MKRVFHDNYQSRSSLQGRHKDLVQNWVPVWPQLDQGYPETFDEKFFKQLQPEDDYKPLLVSSLKKYKGERKLYRQLKIGMFTDYLDMHSYEENEQGLDIWSKDALVYNTRKRKLKHRLLDADIETDSEE